MHLELGKMLQPTIPNSLCYVDENSELWWIELWSNYLMNYVIQWPHFYREIPFTVTLVQFHDKTLRSHSPALQITCKMWLSGAFRRLQGHAGLSWKMGPAIKWSINSACLILKQQQKWEAPSSQQQWDLFNRAIKL